MKLKIRIVYGFISYCIALVLLLSPFSMVETPAIGRILPFVGGAFLICTGLITNFEVGLLRIMRFSDCVTCTFFGSLFVMIFGVVFEFGGLFWPVLSLAFIQAAVSGVALKTHQVNRQRIV